MFGFLAVILGPLMRLVYGIIPNFALTLIVFTVLVRIVSLPLNINQQKSMAKMAVFNPMMEEIREKYKNNQDKMNEELFKLQQEYGFNPMAGCLPMLIDMVILFGIIEVVYRPVQYILQVPTDAIRTACENLGIATNNVIAMQTTLIQTIHSGAAMPAGLTTEQFDAIKNFNTMFLGIDMCDIAGLRVSILMVFPLIAALTMFFSVWFTQKLSGNGAQLQGSMKYTMWLMNAFFIYYCFNAPVGFSVYYATSNICMVLRSLLTYTIYNPEKMKVQFEEELAAKKAAAKVAAKSKKTVVVKENGKDVAKEVPAREVDRLRLERARQLEEQWEADARTRPLTEAERAEAMAAAKGKKK